MNRYESNNQRGRHTWPEEDEPRSGRHEQRAEPRTTARRPASDSHPTRSNGRVASRREYTGYGTEQRERSAYRQQASGRRVAVEPAGYEARNSRRQPPRRSNGRRGGDRNSMRSRQIAGLGLAAVLVIISNLFCVQLTRLGMLPAKYCVMLWVIMLAVSACLVALQLRPARAIGAKAVTGVLVFVMLVGLIYLSKGISTLSSVTDVSVQYYSVSVYVMADDSAQSIEDAVGYSFGILADLDRDNTDECLQAIVEAQGASLTAVEYESIVELAQALLDGEVQAVVVNTSYISVLEEASTDGAISEELGQFDDNTRIIFEYMVEKVIDRLIIEGATGTTDAGTAAYVGDDDVYTISEDPFIVYISGNDSSGTLASTGRSDVNILAVVNPSTRRILLVNTPRDYYVTLAFANSKDKLTHAGIYGVDVSMQALEDLYGVAVQYYVRLNFTGFEEIIDALGGVSVYSEYAFTSTHGGYTFVVGYNTVNGAQALGFVRERYSFSDGDRQRGKNQMAMIEAVINKAVSPAILTGYMDLMTAVSGAVATNMSQNEISSLVQWQLSTGGHWSIESTSVTGSDSTGTVYSMGSTNVYRMIPSDDSVAAAVELINDVIIGF